MTSQKEGKGKEWGGAKHTKEQEYRPNEKISPQLPCHILLL